MLSKGEQNMKINLIVYVYKASFQSLVNGVSFTFATEKYMNF